MKQRNQPRPPSAPGAGRVPRPLSELRGKWIKLLVLAVLLESNGSFPTISTAAAEVVTLAGTGQPGAGGDGGPAALAQLNNPFGVLRAPDGTVYICDTGNHRIRQVGIDGIIRTVAGSGEAGYSGDGGLATQARLNEPYEVRLSAAGDLYFVEMRNHVIRKVDARTRVITTWVGTGKAGFNGDGGPPGRAQLAQPHSLQFDAAGNLYICDIGNHRVRWVDVGRGVLETLTGTGERRTAPDGAAWAGAALHGPRAVDFDRQGNLWLALREGNAVYRLNATSRTLERVAGTGEKGLSGDGGPAAQARLSGPKGVKVGPDGWVYVADTESHTVRRIDPTGRRIERVAGTGDPGDGPEGNPLKCRMRRPHGVDVAADGTILIGDSEAHRVRLIRTGILQRP